MTDDQMAMREADVEALRAEVARLRKELEFERELFTAARKDFRELLAARGKA